MEESKGVAWYQTGSGICASPQCPPSVPILSLIYCYYGFNHRQIKENNSDLQNFKILFSFPCRMRAKPFKPFHWIEAYTNPDLQQEDPVHETWTLYLHTLTPPHPLGHPEKGREGLEAWFATLHFNEWVILRVDILLQPSEYRKYLWDAGAINSLKYLCH